MKYSFNIGMDSISTTKDMDSWMDFLSNRFNSSVHDFDIRFDRNDLKDPFKCTIHANGSLLNYLRLKYYYRRMTPVVMGW